MHATASTADALDQFGWDVATDGTIVVVSAISDEDGAICEAWGVWQLKKFMGREYMGIVRATFLVGRDGTIARAWPKVRVKGHVDEVIGALGELG